MMSASPSAGLNPVSRLLSPFEVLAAQPRLPHVSTVVERGRAAVADALDARSDRLVVIVGPCSIHDPQAALDYAQRLARERARLADELEIVMRVYFEKPRTTVGWKGLINDPYLDGSFRIDAGLVMARTLLNDVNTLGLPAATEFLDPFTPAYIADLVSWGAIGARTTESQTHREMASGLPMPIGFKNGTDGNVQIAADAIQAAARAHRFISIDSEGSICTVTSKGNPLGHAVLRGGKEPNYDAVSVRAAAARLHAAGARQRLIVDASHANSQRQYRNQIPVCAELGAQIASGCEVLAGVMIESNLAEGRQDAAPGKTLEYGKSITDACLSWTDTVDVLEQLAGSVRARRLARTALSCEAVAAV
ncbi:3-deoxy-7-phosphoheptulonate synthase [Paraburkholderia phenazinium]|nr:3-deoxy-7-phosphoheptulonate synthase [Paraburkholderia phenazinium]